MLVELVHLLGEFRDRMVIVGGWVPGLLFPDASEQYVGTLDIDLALDFSRIVDDSYTSILQALTSRGYRQDPQQPFRFFRDVAVGEGSPIVVAVDLLAPEYGGTGRGRRTQRVQDVRARKVRGCDLAFDNPVSATIEGSLPGGGIDRVSVRLAGVVPFLVMKGMALADRVKEKDAYDVVFCLRYFPGSIGALVEIFRPHIRHSLVQEGLGKIRTQFLSVDHSGPRWVADFQEITDSDERAIEQRRAYEFVASWLDALGIEPWPPVQNDGTSLTQK